MRMRRHSNFSERLAYKLRKEEEREQKINDCLKKQRITSCEECLHKYTCTRRKTTWENL